MTALQLSGAVATKTGVGCPTAGVADAAEQADTETMQQAVEQYADGLEETLDGYMQRVSVGDASLQTREYRQMMNVVEQLEAALEEAVAADHRDFDEFFTVLQALMGDMRSFLPEQRLFTQLSDDIVQSARAALAEVRRRIEDDVTIHMDVPEEVKETAQVWSETADVVEQVAPTLSKLTRVNGWSGPAAMTYRQMADVQVAANEEFQYLPRAMADAYDVISTLNRAVLIAVHDALRTTLQQATSTQPGFPGQLFRRVQQFERAIERCNTELLTEALDISAEGTDHVAGFVDDIRSATAVLGDQWPSGTSKSGLQPGDTARQLVGWLSSDVAPVARRAETQDGEASEPGAGEADDQGEARTGQAQQGPSTDRREMRTDVPRRGMFNTTEHRVRF